MRWHRDAKLVYLAHPKTASVSTTRALDGIGFTNPEGLDHHARLSRITEEVDWTGWEIVTTVRDHRDALVSWWHVQGGGHAFGPRWLEWLTTASGAKRYFRPGRLWWIHTEVATRVLRFKSLERELNEVLTAHGLPEVELPHANRNVERDGRPWRDFYGPEMLAVVEDTYGAEMTKLGYPLLAREEVPA